MDEPTNHELRATYTGVERRQHVDIISEIDALRRMLDEALIEAKVNGRIRALVMGVVALIGGTLITLAWDDRKQMITRLDMSITAQTAATTELTRLRIDHTYLQSQVDRIRDNMGK